ncbi:MAG: DMT family transporter [Gaiellaceae bacterium]
MESQRTAYVMLAGMALCFGGTWPAGKLAADEIEPFAVATVRFALATVLLFAWSRLAAARPRRPLLADLPLIAVMALTAVAGYNVLFLYGVRLASAGDGAIIVPGLAPAFTALLAWVALRQPLGARAAAGLALAFAGLVVVIGPGGELDGDRLLGDGLLVAGALCWAVYSLIGPAATGRFGTVGSTLYATALGTLMLVPFSFVGSGWQELLDASAGALVSVGYLAVFGTVVAFVLLYEGVRRIGSSQAISFALLVPIFGVLGAALIADEEIGWVLVAGGALVLAGLWLVQRPRQAATP